MAPPRPSNKPRNESFTQDVIARGADAFKDRRTSQQYDRSMYQQAFQQMGGQYQPYQQSGQYDQWRQQQGFMPDNYTPTFGRTDDGAYAGFKTQGLLQAAVKGAGESLRDQDRYQAQALQQMADQQLQSVMSQYEAGQKDTDPVKAAQMQHMPSPGSSSDMDPMTLLRADRMNRDADREQRAKLAHNEDVARWAADAADPYYEAIDFAQQVENTPLRDYATKAAAMYGVDPMVARGWYDEKSQLGDYRDQRDLESIDNFGAPYSDYQQAYNQMTRQDEQMANEATDAEEQQARDYISQVSGIDPTALASGAKMDMPTLFSVVSSPAYEQAMAELDQQSDADGINSVLEAVFQQDPEIYRVLQAQYGWQADAYDQFGG